MSQLLKVAEAAAHGVTESATHTAQHAAHAATPSLSLLGDNLPALAIVVPLLAAPLVALMIRPALAWSLAALAGLTTLAVTGGLLARVLDSGPIVYAVGGWAGPWGIEYRIDTLSAGMLVLVAGIGAVSLLYARASVAREIPPARASLFYSLMLLCLTGLLGMCISGDVFNVFVFLEISSLSSYALIGLGSTRRAFTAAFNYLILGTIGATFYVIGIGLLYMMTGSLNMADLATLVPAQMDTTTVQMAIAFLAVGLSLKAALFPLHLWLPNAYAYAPSVVTAFLAATATKVSIYVLVRFVFTVFGGTGLLVLEGPLGLSAGTLICVLALAGVVVASLSAIYQEDAKRLLAYSSVAQVGYMLLGVGLASPAGLSAGLIHVFNHALIKFALFLAVGAVVWRTGSAHMAALAGAGKRMPWTMAAFVIAGLSLIGVPGTVGFVSKWMLLQAALAQQLWLVAGLILFTSLLAVVYVWKMIEAAYFRPVPEGGPEIAEAPLSLRLPLWLVALACIYFGLDASGPVGIAETATRTLLEGGA
ncbi:monovalent cation/H+ antiporter subunit D family protein [Roseospirillum parvum]|uniref:Multicomponent Na+:H+ antiporter subunit D n=1 Tax=Roseospirillum parvum TaxID=83401 RepID=A0A1G7XLC9_9PROT|nr:monovalent cation/H+ antiporter subunit D family protein [Roseospirillum parvum]SDG84911.1 multicomponent Na+:H+ antiporter subunit D [Roseospirillum parvum]